MDSFAAVCNYYLQGDNGHVVMDHEVYSTDGMDDEDEPEQCLSLAFEGIFCLVFAEERLPCFLVGFADLKVYGFEARGKSCPVVAVGPDGDSVIVGEGEGASCLFEDRFPCHALIDDVLGEISRPH